MSTRANHPTTSGQLRWPPAGSYMTANGQDLMAADTRGLAQLIDQEGRDSNDTIAVGLGTPGGGDLGPPTESI